MVQFVVTDWTGVFAHAMGMFKEFTTIRFCADFHAVSKLLDPSNVVHVNHFLVRFDKVVHLL